MPVEAEVRCPRRECESCWQCGRVCRPDALRVRKTPRGRWPDRRSSGRAQWSGTSFRILVSRILLLAMLHSWMQQVSCGSVASGALTCSIKECRDGRGQGVQMAYAYAMHRSRHPGPSFAGCSSRSRANMFARAGTCRTNSCAGDAADTPSIGTGFGSVCRMSIEEKMRLC